MPQITLDEDKMLKVFTDWHEDEVTNRRTAMKKYAKPLLERLRAQAMVKTRVIICADCGRPATCYGKRPTREKAQSLCDDCCDHGKAVGHRHCRTIAQYLLDCASDKI